MAFVLELAPSNGYYYQDTASNDAIIRVALPNKKLHIGGNIQGAPAIATFSDNQGVIINNTLNVTQDILYNGESLDTRYTLEANNPWYTVSNTTYLASNFSLDVQGTINASNILVNGTPIEATVSSGDSVWTLCNNKVFIASNNFVGVGTSNPQTQLHVRGNTTLDGSLTIPTPMTLGGIFIQKRNPTGSNINVTTYVNLWNTTDTNLSTLCNVGIGTDAPNASLHVAGNTIVDNTIYTGGLSIGIEPTEAPALESNATGTGTLPPTWRTSPTSNVIYAMSNVGIFTSTPEFTFHVEGDIYASGDVVGLSDCNFKSNIRSITAPLDKLSKIQGYTFNMAGDTRQKIGLLAQEVQQVFPELVYSTSQGHLSLAYANMAGVFVSAINDLTSKVQELEAKLASIHK